MKKVVPAKAMIGLGIIIISSADAATGSSTDGEAAAAGAGAAPVRKRTQLRHVSSGNNAHAEDQTEEQFDPFIGIPRDLQADGSMLMSMSMSVSMPIPTPSPLSFSMGQAVEETAPPTPLSSMGLICTLGCEDDAPICAFPGQVFEPRCYRKCPDFPIASNRMCSFGDICVYSTFACGSYLDVMNEFCECSAIGLDETGSFLCRTSECGLEAPLVFVPDEEV